MRNLLLALSFVLVVSPLAHAQDFGVMESAETVNQGNFKFRINPLLFFGKHGGDDEVGVAALVGYGFTRRFDLEGGFSFADGVRIFGGTAEFNVARDQSVNFSIIPGFRVRRGDRTLHSAAVDLLLLGSHRLTPRLDVYGGFDMAFESVDDDFGDDADYNTFHLVPGLEYKLHQDLELLVEVGLGLNDSARHYLSGGLAFYFR
jgi:hypothetical protein